jgi:hypothetical protein
MLIGDDTGIADGRSCKYDLNINSRNKSQPVVNTIAAAKAAIYILVFGVEMKPDDTATDATTALKAKSVEIANLYTKMLDIDVEMMSCLNA